MRHSATGRRPCFVSERRLFASSRRRREPAVGRVGRRTGPAGATAARNRAAIRARAASRFLICCRYSDAVTVNDPSVNRPASRCSAVDNTCSGQPVSWERSTDSSTLESAVFTPWPPGPDEREKFHLIALAGTVSAAVT